MFDGVLNAITSTASKLAPLATFINPGVGAAMGAVGSYLGGQSANKANQMMAQNQMNFQAAQTKEQMEFQERMSNTAYQRSTSDLKKAGLNPMLAYTQGGASTPNGGAGTGASAQMENVLGNSTNSAFQSAMTSQQIRNNQAQIYLTGAQIDATEADAAYKRQITASDLMAMPNISAENKRLLSQAALNDSMKQYNSAKTTSENLGAPYGFMGSGQAVRLGSHLGSSALDWYNKTGKDKTNKFLNEHMERRNGYNK
jgi:hypothetical protein